MSVALRGNLKDFGISEIFQLIGQQRKTGLLEFEAKREKLQMFLDNGSVVSASPVGLRSDSAIGDMMVRCGYLTREQVADLQRAADSSAQPIARLAVSRNQLTEEEAKQVEDLLTREAIFTLLRWETGSFDFQAREVNHNRTADRLLGAEQILMDGMRIVDEWRSFQDELLQDDGVYQRVDRSATPRGDGYRQIDDARRVYDLIDGRLSVRRIIDLSRLGTFEAGRILVELRRNEMIEPADVSRLRRGPMAERIHVESGQVRKWLFAMIPLGLLAGIAALANRIDVPQPAVAGVAIERAELESLRQVYITRGLRHGLESYRFRRGHWPHDLAQVGKSVDVLAPALAASPAPPYYKVRSDDDIVLLAPER